MGYRFLGGVAGLAFILCGDEGEEVRRKWRMVRIRTREVERAGGESRRCRRGAQGLSCQQMGSALAVDHQEGGSTRPQASMPGLVSPGMSP